MRGQVQRADFLGLAAAADWSGHQVGGAISSTRVPHSDDGLH